MILRAGELRAFTWVFSQEVLREYSLVGREHGIYRDMLSLIVLIRYIGLKVAIPEWLPGEFTRIEDKDDRGIFAAAYAGKAMFVTGNHRHFPWKTYSGVEIVSPRDFYDML